MNSNDPITLIGFEYTEEDIMYDIVQTLNNNEFECSNPLLNATPLQPPVNEIKPNWQGHGPPDRACYPGQFDFTVEVNSKNVNKKKYLFSHRLNRIYVDIDVEFSMHFNWKCPPGESTMYVRATAVFSDESQAEKRVERCVQHYHQDHNTTNLSEEEYEVIRKNVLHSSREIGTAGVVYCGNNAPDSWLSVLVQLTKSSPNPVPHAYKFVCKNSCSNGINRRPLAIIFTLEDASGTVFGRQMVGARVCSCPRRDIFKDEEAEGGTKRGKRPLTHKTQQTNNKKIKLEANHNHQHVPIKPTQIPPGVLFYGDHILETALQLILKMMQHTLQQNTDPALVEPYTASINNIKAEIEKITKPDV